MATTALGLVTIEPTGRILPLESNGTLPQIQVVCPPGLMKLRPKAAPKEPGAGKRGTVVGRFWISCLIFVNVARKSRSISLRCIINGGELRTRGIEAALSAAV